MHDCLANCNVIVGHRWSHFDLNKPGGLLRRLRNDRDLPLSSRRDRIGFKPMSSPEERRERVNVLGVGVSVLNLDSALAAVQRALEKKTKGYVCVTGVHGVMEAQNDAAFRGILNQAF